MWMIIHSFIHGKKKIRWNVTLTQKNVRESHIPTYLMKERVTKLKGKLQAQEVWSFLSLLKKRNRRSLFSAFASLLVFFVLRCVSPFAFLSSACKMLFVIALTCLAKLTAKLLAS
jgi:hypothetical protein